MKQLPELAVGQKWTNGRNVTFEILQKFREGKFEYFKLRVTTASGIDQEIPVGADSLGPWMEMIKPVTGEWRLVEG